ncbi:hypothetical protein [Chroococcidiopsis sp. SAG 2025]|uniref:hypothetical protein n=1 Tax=Chroococcidiopsis sp. SAG 2025 TaxID=171389 RepID=UPI002936F0E7|nr:hypothetical protein [Chroococcidiopsis sp. SAG 2025]
MSKQCFYFVKTNDRNSSAAMASGSTAHPRADENTHLLPSSVPAREYNTPPRSGTYLLFRF